MEILLATIWTALALFILYETSAVFSYLNSLVMRPLNFLTRVRQYNQIRSSGTDISYSEYMNYSHDNFFVKLFSCRHCFGLWLAFFASLAIDKPFWLPVVYFGGHFICSFFKAMSEWMEWVVNHD